MLLLFNMNLEASVAAVSYYRQQEVIASED